MKILINIKMVLYYEDFDSYKNGALLYEDGSFDMGMVLLMYNACYIVRR